MKTKKNPTGCQQLELSNVNMHRYVDCPDYDHCLDIAVEHDWQGFNCLGCSQFESEVVMPYDEEIIEEIMDFLKEHELPQKNTVYDAASCAVLVKESIKRLFRAVNDSRKEKECVANKKIPETFGAKLKKSMIADKVQMYNRFLEEWNQQGMIQHRKVTTRMRKAIDKVIKNADYPLAEVFKAFINYSQILRSPKFTWSYKWTMEDFLNRGLHKFVDEALPFSNNRKDVKSASNNPYANFSCG